jgi:hypothetical protein
VYEQLLAPLREHPFSLLELGVWKGDSLEMWRDAFPLATIVGVDLAPPDIDLGPRVHIVPGDQTDADLLGQVRADHAPDGFAVIIDDASHIGSLSAGSLKALYDEHLRPGGLYIIEDWGTGYMDTWPDGAEPSGMVSTDDLDRSPGPSTDGGEEPRALPSHDAGMIGLVKRLIDHTAAGTLSVHQPQWVKDPLRIEWMRIYDGLVILKKPEGGT